MRGLLSLGPVLLLLSGCNESTTETGDDRQINLEATAFSPRLVTVSAGTEITWVNTSGMVHTITPDQHTQWNRVEMNTTGQTFTVRFDTPGTYEYYCEPHQSVGMTGTITVTP